MNYIGSKLSILNYIEDTINDFVKTESNDLILCDIFSGTGAVRKVF